MKKFMKKKLGNEKGMTLIELLAVIVILAIIAAIAIPAIGNLIQNSRNGAVKADFQNAINSANIYFTENPSDADATHTELKGTYLDDLGSLVEFTVTKGTAGASNTIVGKASADKDATTIEYTITTGLTNKQLSSIENKAFVGTIVAP